MAMNNCFLHFITTLVLLSIAIPVAARPPPVKDVARNLARGSALKMMADLTGALPMEVWKSSVVLEHIHASQQKRKAASSAQVWRNLLHDKGVAGLWSGCSARMVEGFFSGAVLLAGKETVRRSMMASPLITKAMSPAAIGFFAGAAGGACQSLVMTPTSFLVTATTGSNRSVLSVAKDAWAREGLRGMYRGAPAVAARQATNWASRQGFTELVRPRIQIAGVPGEIAAGCLGGALSCWNTPFEVARIHSQSKGYARGSNNQQPPSPDASLMTTMHSIVQERGIGGLYVGVVPRVVQACYQTVFLVCIPRIIER